MKAVRHGVPLAAPAHGNSRPAVAFFYPHEQVILAFYGILAAYALVRPPSAAQCVPLLLIPLGMTLLCVLEHRVSRGWFRIVREWVSLGLIVASYWSLQVFAQPKWNVWQATWVGWDHFILHNLGLKRLVETGGSVIPNVLETTYFLLYAFPAVALGVVYAIGERRQTKKFLFVVFSGTLAAYALLPILPAESPRIAFPGQDVPSYLALLRPVNIWLLDHLDISTSVFPSGHVAVAFACAFGLLSAVPSRREVWLLAFGVACLVFVATIYGRYHYVADGLASIVIVTVAWLLIERTCIEKVLGKHGDDR